MELEGILIRPFNALKRQPQLLLPATLNWFFQAALMLLTTAFIAANSYLIEPEAVAYLLLEPAFLVNFLLLSLPAIGVGLLFLIAWFFVATFVSVSYLQASIKIKEGKAVSLSELFSFGKKNYWGYLKSFASLLGVFLGVVGFMLVIAGGAFILLSKNNVAFLAAALVIGLILLAVLLVFSLFFWLLAPVSVLSGKVGLEAPGAVYVFLKKNLVKTVVCFAAVAVVSFALNQLSSIAYQLPLVGAGVSALIALPLVAWSSIVLGLVYLEK